MQTKGDGPVDLLVADFTTPENVRAMPASTNRRWPTPLPPAARRRNSFWALACSPSLSTRLLHAALSGHRAARRNVAEDIAGVYFRQSEQIPTRVRLGAAELFDRDENGKPRRTWRAGGLIAQFLPKRRNACDIRICMAGTVTTATAELHGDEAWEEARMLSTRLMPTS